MRHSSKSWSLDLPTVLLTATIAPTACAQSLLSRDEQNVINFAFATQLGSGVYSVSGRTLQIYRLPFGHTLRSTDESSFGVELTLPVTFGFYDFELQDIEDGDIPTQVDSLSFVPGLTLVFELQPDWTLEPYFEAGIARARDVNAHANVYAVGVASLYEFGGQGLRLAAAQRSHICGRRPARHRWLRSFRAAADGPDGAPAIRPRVERSTTWSTR